jgi:hypothetical protein
MDLRLSESDCIFLKIIRVGVTEDTRTRVEADRRFVIPEWLRRAAWRQFWTSFDCDALQCPQYQDHDTATQALQPYAESCGAPRTPPTGRIRHGVTMYSRWKALSEGQLRFGTDALAESKRLQRPRDMRNALIQLVRATCDLILGPHSGMRP